MSDVGPEIDLEVVDNADYVVPGAKVYYRDEWGTETIKIVKGIERDYIYVTFDDGFPGSIYRYDPVHITGKPKDR